MKKEIIYKWGKKYYLLGINQDDEKVWLEESKFDCNWYWGIGYVEIFNKYYTDIDTHTHFDCLFFNNKKSCINNFRDYFKQTTLNDKEIWEILELMKTLYSLRNYSDLLYNGGAFISSNKFIDDIKNNDEYNRINNELIPKILNEIYKMLGGK